MTTTTMDPTILYPDYTQRKTFKSDVEVDSNFVLDDSTPMTIDPAGAAHIIALIINLYSDPEAAVVREYISNALDSHTQAKQSAPVEVFSPTSLNPNFVVRDHGVGMSPTELRGIYAVIGASTKRDDMEQLGAYGLGCKSALSLATQFTVKAVKDGVKTIAIVMRKADGTGDLDITKIERTDEADGVTITIPVSNSHTFNKKLMEYVYYAKLGTILIDGRDTYDNVFRSGSYTYIPELKTYYSTKNRSSFMVTTGGASYKVDTAQLPSSVIGDVFRSWYGHLSFISEVPIGSVDLTPSRDEIQYTPRTIQFLDSLGVAIIQHLQKKLMAELETAATRKEYIEKLLDNSQALSQLGIPINNNLTWKNEKVVTQFEVDLIAESAHQYGGTFYTTVECGATNITHTFVGNNYYMVVPAPDATDHKAIASLRNKVRTRWLTFNKVKKHRGELDTHKRNTLNVFFGAAPVSPWFTEFHTEIKWDDFKPYLAEWRSISMSNRQSSPSAAPTPVEKITYPVYSFTTTGATGEETPYDKIPKDALYVTPANSRDGSFESDVEKGRVRGYSPGTIKAMGLEGKKVVFVRQGRKVEALFKKVGANLGEATAHIETSLKNAADKFTPNQKTVLYFKINSHYSSLQYNNFFTMVYNNKDKIDDKVLVKKAEDWIFVSSWDSVVNNHHYRFLVTAVPSLRDEAQKGVNPVKYTTSKYPLARVDNYRPKEYDGHIIAYINYVHNNDL